MSDERSAGSAGITRREMLAALGASLSLAGLAACRRPVERIAPFADAPEQIIPGVPRYYATTMPFGHSAYGLLVETHDGRPTKIEGNPLHPSTGGASSALMQASILDLYDPDRSNSVRRLGEPARWPDFVKFWTGLHASCVETRGRGLAVLSESFASPTLSRLRQWIHEVFPEVRWATYEAVSPENLYRGVELATGRSYRPRYRFDEASTVLALDADFLLADPENVRHTREFTRARRVEAETDSMSRLWVLESGHSSTGAMADHRIGVRSGEIGSWLAALSGMLAALGLPVDATSHDAPGEIEARWLETVARELMDRRGHGLILAGYGQPLEVHARVLTLNAALGNLGRTVTYYPVDAAELPSRDALTTLVGEMRAGEVDSLIILGGNPVYDAPVDHEFATALAGVEHSIHLSSHFDETSRVAQWHLPRAHYLEAWGDARAVGETASVTQPIVRPLLGGRSPIELLALLGSGEERSGYDEVRRTWTSILGEQDFERKWGKVLHDGLLAGSEQPGVAPRLNGVALPESSRAPVGPGQLEIVFRPSAALHDGRFSNIAWLQELPDSITKLTWDNPALLSPATLEALGLRDEEMVRLHYRGRELELPVWALPGQADWTVGLTLGFGRSAAGRVGNEVGFDAYALRTGDSPDFGAGLRLEKTGRTHPLASTQDHGSMEGRPIVREATLEQYRRRPDFAVASAPHPPLEQPFDDQPYDRGYQWGMAIDLASCTGCNACVIACQSENNTPVVGKPQVSNGREMHWIRVDRYFTGDAKVAFQPMPCMHCENAPCEQVCPVGATVHDAEGLNVMVYNRCIGTRYCSNNCPYKVRRFNYFNFTKETPEILKMAQNPDVTVRSRGVIEKCTYCTQRINAAKIDARLAGRAIADGDVETACQQACPANAIVFGNLLDPHSRVAALKRQSRDYALLAELNNRPRTTYLAKLRNPHPGLDS